MSFLWGSGEGVRHSIPVGNDRPGTPGGALNTAIRESAVFGFDGDSDFVDALALLRRIVRSMRICSSFCPDRTNVEGLPSDSRDFFISRRLLAC